MVAKFDEVRKQFGTYQRKSAKRLLVVLNGIQSGVEARDMQKALEVKRFKVYLVYNILNRDKVRLPLYRVVLEPD